MLSGFQGQTVQFPHQGSVQDELAILVERLERAVHKTDQRALSFGYVEASCQARSRYRRMRTNNHSWSALRGGIDLVWAALKLWGDANAENLKS
jgi:hypothetical protein